jgi:mannose-6-phosphate isomerase
MTAIVVLTANQPQRRPYRGGPRIAAFRGSTGTDDHTPEDWVGSTTPLFGHDRLGLSELPDGRLLTDPTRSPGLVAIMWLRLEQTRDY